MNTDLAEVFVASAKKKTAAKKTNPVKGKGKTGSKKMKKKLFHKAPW